jgi:hypothetical protein
MFFLLRMDGVEWAVEGRFYQFFASTCNLKIRSPRKGGGKWREVADGEKEPLRAKKERKSG